MKAKMMLKNLMLAGLMSATVLGGIAPAYAQGREDGWRGRSEERAGRPDGNARRGGDQRGPRGDSGARDQAQRWQQQRQADRRPAQPQAERRQQQPDRQWNRAEGRVAVSRDALRGDARVRDRADNDRYQSRDDRRSGNRQDWRDNRQAQRPEWRDNRRDNRVSSGGHWRGSLADTRRFDDRTRWHGQRRWDNDWRQDRRYDWRSYRSRYGDRYRAGRYYAPRGWSYGYTRFSTGIFLNGLLFSNSYWIDDPYSYRLPPAYGTLRWVRYYDDALLVDIRDGYVVDVIHDFFW